MHTIDITDPLVHGHADLEQTAEGVRIHRLPAWLRRLWPEPRLMAMEQQPAGVRLVLDTDARALELTMRSTRAAFPGAERPRGVLDVVVDGEVAAHDVLTGGVLVITDPSTGETSSSPGPAHTSRIELSPGTHRVELWLPYRENIVLESLRAEADSPPAGGGRPLVRPVAPSGPRWVHHGSSISHGSNAATPLGTWPVRAARAVGADLRNLGFGGSALVDAPVAQVIRDAPADVISLKLGINLVGGDIMRRRALVPAMHGFLDTIRQGHPNTPLVLVSPLHCGLFEGTPGPSALDPQALARGKIRFMSIGDPADIAGGRLDLPAVREALAEVCAAREDSQLHHIDGLDLYGAQDEAELPLPDALHPGPEAHARIAERFVERVFADGGAFAQHGASA
ncbi:GDSL-type esterase/lipase family protein [Brachybacterium halotolerans subsp. kimchii]|uniref:GDSL-type esterase/lipase family protein n=1 Tax=Brachybacterium halotolerans TaxID=2795215 RepID=UPI001E4F7776|nr:SGNH/GDSL hydrolase family protein [Brachybacterium halotolerans]UEJ81329.1 GDSL-type esterase/lipase family protein [Brachybacterium halotolerans subsp. kimchii]